MLSSARDSVSRSGSTVSRTRSLSGCAETRRQVSDFYFRLFNRTVFQGRLPANTAIYWNKRLLTTAGRCLQADIGDKRVAFIQLSVKICDTKERVRDTLLHEMCHAATWVLDGVQHTDHGDCFLYWAERANRRHPEIPPVQTFHTYTIHKQFIYRCRSCNNRMTFPSDASQPTHSPYIVSRIGRHTKSLKTDRQACAQCGGRFQLLNDRKRAKTDSRTRQQSDGRRKGKNSLAKFVRENRQREKQRNKQLSVGKLVQELSRQFDLRHRK